MMSSDRDYYLYRISKGTAGDTVGLVFYVYTIDPIKNIDLKLIQHGFTHACMYCHSRLRLLILIDLGHRLAYDMCLQ